MLTLISDAALTFQCILADLVKSSALLSSAFLSLNNAQVVICLRSVGDQRSALRTSNETYPSRPISL